MERKDMLSTALLALLEGKATNRQKRELYKLANDLKGLNYQDYEPMVEGYGQDYIDIVCQVPLENERKYRVWVGLDDPYCFIDNVEISEKEDENNV